MGGDSVAVFWDYENCEPPSTIDSYTVASSIRQIAHKYGVVKTFKAYAAVSEVISPRLSVLRSELTACGVSFVDCPHNGRKDVADKMMIGAQGYSFSTIVFELLIAGVLNAVDMMAYAMDTPAPATIILISGDRDFAYAVALLRLRKYRIVVVAPTAVHNSLKLQASHFYDWFQNVSHSPSRPSIPSTRTPSGAMRFPEPPSPGMERLAKTVNSLRSSAPVFVPSPPTKGGDPDTDRGVLVESESETVERVDTTTLGASDPSEVSILESNGGDSLDDPSESTVQTTIAWTAPTSPKAGPWSLSENQGTTSTSPLTIPSFVLPQRPATALPSLGLGTNLSVSTPSSVSNSLPTTYSSIARIPQPLPQEARTTQTRSIARSASIPSIFKPLVKILEASRQEGVSMVSSSDLGTSLIRASPGIYERAGVMQLKKYIELAKEQGVVSCRTGANGNIWVGLAPRFVTG